MKKQNKCINCGRALPDNSLFCNWCGYKQIKEKKKKAAVSAPKPRKRGNLYSAQVMIDGTRHTVSAQTEAEFYRKAEELKKGKKNPAELSTLRELIDRYISSNSNTLSPSTLRSYAAMTKRAFKGFMEQPIEKIDFQRLVNSEAGRVKPKTVRNEWGLITAALNAKGIKAPDVNLPATVAAETEFLDAEQVSALLDAIKGDRAELIIILALHGLRQSEIYNLTAESIREGMIHVKGATVRGPDGFISKPQNKTRLSARTVPVLFPRLMELLPESGKLATVPQQTVYRKLGSICRKNGLPVCSLHDLRRTFASIAASAGIREDILCQWGGWRYGSPIVHNIYVKISETDKEIAKTELLNYYKNYVKN